MNPQDRDAYLQRIREIIDRHGWAVQGVLPREGNDERPFCYTVGLSAHGQPEVIVFGVPMEVGQSLLNELGRRAEREGLQPGVVHDVIADLPGYLLPVEDTTEHLTVARQLYPIVRGLQLVLPDQEGRFPWQDGYSMSPDVQPVLGRPA